MLSKCQATINLSPPERSWVAPPAGPFDGTMYFGWEQQRMLSCSPASRKKKRDDKHAAKQQAEKVAKRQRMEYFAKLLQRA